jgi:hypothetical protein
VTFVDCWAVADAATEKRTASETNTERSAGVLMADESSKWWGRR